MPEDATLQLHLAPLLAPPAKAALDIAIGGRIAKAKIATSARRSEEGGFISLRVMAAAFVVVGRGAPKEVWRRQHGQDRQCPAVRLMFDVDGGVKEVGATLTLSLTLTLTLL